MKATATQVASGPNMRNRQDWFYPDRTPQRDIDTPISVVNGRKWVNRGCDIGWEVRGYAPQTVSWPRSEKCSDWEDMPTQGLGAAHLDLGA